MKFNPDTDILPIRLLAKQGKRRAEGVAPYDRPGFERMIEKIAVHEACKDEAGNKIREIEIFYRFVGKIE